VAAPSGAPSRRSPTRARRASCSRASPRRRRSAAWRRLVGVGRGSEGSQPLESFRVACGRFGRGMERVRVRPVRCRRLSGSGPRNRASSDAPVRRLTGVSSESRRAGTPPAPSFTNPGRWFVGTQRTRTVGSSVSRRRGTDGRSRHGPRWRRRDPSRHPWVSRPGARPGRRTTQRRTESAPDEPRFRHAGTAVGPTTTLGRPPLGVGVRKGPRSRPDPGDASTAGREHSESWPVESAGAPGTCGADRHVPRSTRMESARGLPGTVDTRERVRTSSPSRGRSALRPDGRTGNAGP